MTHRPIVLASQSPRRQQLLSQLGWQYRILVSNTDESFPSDMPIDQVPMHIATQKTAALSSQVFAQQANALIIAADTIVQLEGQILGKPNDRQHAIDILSQLSGKTHQVITGVCLTTATQQHCFANTTLVHFLPLTHKQIIYYIDHYQPYDKAGAYAIQEWIGMVGIKGIEGCYFNVMGLPVSALCEALQHFGQ